MYEKSEISFIDRQEHVTLDYPKIGIQDEIRTVPNRDVRKWEKQRH